MTRDAQVAQRVAAARKILDGGTSGTIRVNGRRISVRVAAGSGMLQPVGRRYRRRQGSIDPLDLQPVN